MRNVTFFRFGKYSAEHSLILPDQGYGSVFFTTMEPLPGVLVVEWKCSDASNQCDIKESNAYDHLNSTSKRETDTQKKRYNVTDSSKEVEAFTTSDTVCMTSKD